MHLQFNVLPKSTIATDKINQYEPTAQQSIQQNILPQHYSRTSQYINFWKDPEEPFLELLKSDGFGNLDCTSQLQPLINLDDSPDLKEPFDVINLSYSHGNKQWELKEGPDNDSAVGVVVDLSVSYITDLHIILLLFYLS